MMQIATIINYCSNDFRYLQKCVEEARLFSKQILIPVCDHFYNGEKENLELLRTSYHLLPDCQFIQFAYHPKRSYGLTRTLSAPHRNWKQFWHSTARFIGSLFVLPEIEYILFLDVDEIPDGKRFKTYLETGEYRHYDLMRIFGRIYFWQPHFRSVTQHACGLLIKKEAFTPEQVLNLSERFGMYLELKGKKKIVKELTPGVPWIHHYSWVKQEHELLKKVSCWGHAEERDWIQVLEKEKNKPPSWKDPFYGITYEQSSIFFDPFSVAYPKKYRSSDPSNVTYVDRREISEMLIKRDFLL